MGRPKPGTKQKRTTPEAVQRRAGEKTRHDEALQADRRTYPEKLRAAADAAKARADTRRSPPVR